MTQIIRIENASPSWKLIMQSGVGVPCTVGLPVAAFLTDELRIPEPALARTDTILLNGMPVDDIAAAVVPDGARVALAAGLPGIAGLAMKRGSAVRALRGGITYKDEAAGEATPDLKSGPAPGRVTLLLYSLTIEMLGAHFLRRGVVVTAEQFRRYSRFAPDDVCFLSEERMKSAEVPHSIEQTNHAEFLLIADAVAATPPDRDEKPN